MTAHLDPDALAALHYGEAADPAAETHLAACAECRAAREALRRVLDAVGGHRAGEAEHPRQIVVAGGRAVLQRERGIAVAACLDAFPPDKRARFHVVVRAAHEAPLRPSVRS